MKNNFFYEMRADQQYHFYLAYYDITSETPKRNDTPHYHQAMEFVYVMEGKFPVHIDGKSRTLSAGEIAYIRSGQGHYYTSDGDAKVVVLVISTDFLNNPLLNGQCLLPPFMKLSAYRGGVLSQFLYIIMETWAPGNSILDQGIFNTFYGLLAKDFLITGENGSEKNSFPIYDILKYINEHYKEPITLKSLAVRYNYTESYFSACFNTIVNIPLREYINRIRIHHVNAYIESGLTKSQAAVLCGYTNNNTFYRAYNKYKNDAIKEIPTMLPDDENL